LPRQGDDVGLFIADCSTSAQDLPTHAGLPTVLSWAERPILAHLGPGTDYRTLGNTLPPSFKPGYDRMVLEA